NLQIFLLESGEILQNQNYKPLKIKSVESKKGPTGPHIGFYTH
ncbi:MAG: hypothetical protein ACJA01_004325, partial [Saprospiraceae bacterium]